MSAPFWTWGGTLNGRLEPQHAEAQGVVSVLYYGGTYYYTYGYTGVDYSYDAGYTFDYSSETDHVFVLGEDTAVFPDFRYASDGTSQVSQAVVDVTDYDIVYFTWLLNTTSRMPNAVRALTSTNIEIKTSGLAAYGDGCSGIVLPKNFTAGFEAQDSDRVVILSGTASNDGTHRISSVPMDTDGLPYYTLGPLGLPIVNPFPAGRIAAVPEEARWIGPGDADPAPDPDQVKQYMNGQVCVLETTGMTPEVAGAATVTIPGWRWVAKAYIDGVLRTELRETRAGRSWQRNYMGAHVGQLSGVHTLKFELSLEMFTD